MALGAIGYIIKPFEESELLAPIESWLVEADVNPKP